MPSREVVAGILQSGRQAFAQGRFERAINLFRRIQEGYPNAPERPEATLLLAQALEANGEPASALTEFRRLANEFAQTPQASLARTKIPDLERQLATVRPPVVSQVVGAYIRTSAIESLDERELARLRQLGTNTLVVDVARNRLSRPSVTGRRSTNGAPPSPAVVGGGRERAETGVYFKTDWAPVIKDRLAAVVSGAHRQGIQVWAAVSVRRMDWIDAALEWSDWRYNPESSEFVRAETLDLLHPAMPEYLVGFLSDLAASGVQGLVLDADPPSGPGEGFSPYALRRYEREIGQSVDPSRLQLAQPQERLGYAPEFWRWVGWKQREQLKVVYGALQAVRKAYPHVKVVVEVHPEVVTNPRAALAWYAEDLLDLRRYRFDYIALPFFPSLGSWVKKLAENVGWDRLLLLVESSEANRAKSISLPAGTGLIFKEKQVPIGLTKPGR